MNHAHLKNAQDHRSSLYSRILLTILPAALIAVVALSIFNYLELKHKNLEKFTSIQAQSEQQIIDTLKLMDSSYRMLETRLTLEMQTHFPLLLAAYASAGNNPAKMDLSTLKKQMGEQLNIYIIDADAVVRWSTDDSGIGFDFHHYGLNERIQTLRMGNRMATERIRTSVVNGQLDYWIYQPTPDHHFILEIGFNSPKALRQIVKELDPLHITKKLERSAYIDSINIYDVFGQQSSHGDPTIKPDKKRMEMIHQTMAQGKIVIDRPEMVTIYRYLDLRPMKESISNPGKIIRIQLNKQPLHDALRTAALNSFMTVFLFLVALSAVIIFLSKRLTRPLKHLRDTAVAVAAGEMHQRVSLTGSDEVQEVATAFNQMLETLASNELRLEQMVDERTEKLQQAALNAERLEKDKLRLQEVSLKARHAEGLGKIAAGVAHQFNNILASISGNAELIGLQKELGNDGHRFCITITDSVNRGSTLTRNLLAYTGQGFRQARTLHAGEIITHELNVLSIGLPAHATVSADCRSDTPLISMDPTEFRQILLALISNAGKAVALTGGQITVGTTLASLDAAALEQLRIHEGMLDGDYLQLTVKDDGCGMDHHLAAQIFEPFFTVVPVDAGLGLSALLGIVQKLGGGINVQSKLDQGTEISIYLPTISPNNHQQSQTSTPPTHSAGRWILIADDDSSLLKTTQQILEKQHFKVLTATNGEQAVQIFKQHQAEIGAIILDMNMPKLNGEQTLARIRTLEQTTPIWICSGFDEISIASHLYAEGLTGFIPKPYHSADLIMPIRQYIPAH
ncbi:MAG: response regulator [Mariprofundus sp.]|nr:response regulator [Mariprofundus sp.]